MYVNITKRGVGYLSKQSIQLPELANIIFEGADHMCGFCFKDLFNATASRYDCILFNNVF